MLAFQPHLSGLLHQISSFLLPSSSFLLPIPWLIFLQALFELDVLLLELIPFLVLMTLNVRPPLM